MSGATAAGRLVRTALAWGVAGLLAMFSGGLVLAFEGTAQADPVCVPSAAWTETVVVSEAVPATPDSWTAWAGAGDEVRTEEKQAPGEDTDTVRYVYVGETEVEVVEEAVEEAWANFAPNNQQGTFIGPPVAPTQNDDGTWNTDTDERGTWNMHKTLPGGHEDEPDGVYAQGDPSKGGNWFYKRSAKDAVTDVDHLWQKQTRELVPGTPEVPAVTKQVQHPAVECPTPTDPPTTAAPTETPATTAPPEVLPSTATATPEPTDQPTAQPVEEGQEVDEPEVLPAEASAPLKAQQPQKAQQPAQVPQVVAAGYAGWTDAELLGAALVGGGLAMLVSSGTVLVVARRE